MPEVDVLHLSSDDVVRGPTLAAHLIAWAGVDGNRQALAALVSGTAEACIPLAARLAQGGLTGDPGAIIGTNQSGDKQKALDVAAHDHFLDAMCGLSVANFLSEEAEEVISLDPEGRFDVAIDPIDGSSNIGIGAPLGVLFCVFPAGDSFLRQGRDVIAAGYVSFGHSIDFGFSVGSGVAIATFDRDSRAFILDEDGVTIADTCTSVAFNPSHQRRWTPDLRRYVDDLFLGEDGPRAQDFNMRWIAAAVGDLHRILRRGGFFMYPGDSRPGHENGFLRLTYEAFSIAYLIEQAGGAATNGSRPILDLIPNSPHERVPLFFGARSEVSKLHDYLTQSDT